MSVAPKLYAVTDDPALAAVLEQLLAREGWKGEELARRSGLSAKTISRILNGHTTEPKRPTIVALAAAFDVDEAIFTGPRPERQQTQLDQIEASLRRIEAALATGPAADADRGELDDAPRQLRALAQRLQDQIPPSSHPERDAAQGTDG
jgi:transcriptional regulator with XRE-family HTH domain